MVNLAGKSFVITGGNGGIGLGMGEGIVAAGGSVMIWGRKADKNTAAVETLRAMGGRAEALVCDVSDEGEVEASMQASIEAMGRIDGMFANAGRGGTGHKFHELSLENWRAVTAVNLDGVFLCFREAAKHMVEHGHGGSLVAVSSTSAIHGAAGNEAYGTVKTGLLGLVRALAVGYARHDIRVNAVVPGWTETELTSGSDQRFRDITTKRTPVRRWADPSEFREVGAFLADPAQTFHTGQEITLDGGYTIF